MLEEMDRTGEVPQQVVVEDCFICNDSLMKKKPRKYLEKILDIRVVMINHQVILFQVMMKAVMKVRVKEVLWLLNLKLWLTLETTQVKKVLRLLNCKTPLNKLLNN